MKVTAVIKEVNEVATFWYKQECNGIRTMNYINRSIAIILKVGLVTL